MPTWLKITESPITAVIVLMALGILLTWGC